MNNLNVLGSAHFPLERAVSLYGANPKLQYIYHTSDFTLFNVHFEPKRIIQQSLSNAIKFKIELKWLNNFLQCMFIKYKNISISVALINLFFLSLFFTEQRA